jgi:hypothetical protein
MERLLRVNHLERLRLADLDHTGCDQEWYTTRWQRLSGCGPTTAASLLLLQFFPVDQLTQAEALARMEVTWKHVTPNLRGVDTLERFKTGFSAYLNQANVQHTVHCLPIPKAKDKRPLIEEAIRFIKEALEKDMPVPFLNLHNGHVRNLEAYHWVLITAIRCTEDHSSVEVEIVDGGQVFFIDLILWLTTSRAGGGFLYFEAID